MAVTVRIPTQLRELSGGAAEVSADGATVADVLKDLEARHAGFSERLFDEEGELRRVGNGFVAGEQGELRRVVNVLLSDEDIRFLDGVNTDVADGSTLSIVPAVAGG